MRYLLAYSVVLMTGGICIGAADERFDTTYWLGLSLIFACGVFSVTVVERIRK